MHNGCHENTARIKPLGSEFPFVVPFLFRRGFFFLLISILILASGVCQ